MKKLFALASLLFSVACSPVQHPINTRQAEVFNMRQETAVLVRKNEDNQFQMYCSGVWISDRKILTANHCAASYALSVMSDEELAKHNDDEDFSKVPVVGLQVYYKTYNDYRNEYEMPLSRRARKATVVRSEFATDLALIEIEGNVPSHNTAPLRKGGLIDGDDAWVVGHSVGMQFTLSKGIISASRRDNDLTLLQLSVAASPGNSGGPVFDMSGNLIGIVSFSNMRGALMTFATHRDSIIDFLSLSN